MFENVFLLAAAKGNLVTEITTKFGVNWQLFISQLVAFVLLALLLKKFAYKPVLDVLEQRKQRIAESLDNAEKIKAELAKAEATRSEVIEKANAAATKLVDDARSTAAKVLEDETQKAIATAQSIIEKAKEANDSELARMKAELRGEVVRLVAETTAKVAGKVLTDDDQKRLADETNSQLAA